MFRHACRHVEMRHLSILRVRIIPRTSEVGLVESQSGAEACDAKKRVVFPSRDISSSPQRQALHYIQGASLQMAMVIHARWGTPRTPGIQENTVRALIATGLR